MDKQYLIPGAILLGCTVIALGVYLRPSAPTPASGGADPAAESAAPRPSPAARPSGSTGQSTAVPPGGGAPPGGDAPSLPAGVGLLPPGAPAAVQAAADKAAADAIAEMKKSVFLPKCWQPSLAKAADPPKVKFVYEVTFNPAGTQIARGINEDRSGYRQDVSACLNALPMDLKIPPPGTNVRVSLPLELP